MIFFHLAPLSGIALPEQFWFVGQYFGFAVPLFYITSGLSLALRYANGINGPAELKTFYLRRFFRSAPLFYTMIAVHVVIAASIGSNINPNQVIASFLFIFNLIPPYIDGFVWASWSIGVECVFYLLFPIIIALANSTWSATIILIGAFVIKGIWLISLAGTPSAPPMMHHFFLPHLAYFIVGIVLRHVLASMSQILARWGTAILGISLASLIGLGLCVPIVAQTVYPVLGPVGAQMIPDLLFTLALSAFIVGVAMDGKRLLSNAYFCRLGECSFSVYLWHPVIIFIFAKLGLYDAIVQTTDSVLVAYLSAAMVTIGFTLLVANFSYRYIERPGMQLPLSVLRARTA